MLKMLKKNNSDAPQATDAEANPSRKPKKSKGALAAVGALLLASALIRVGVGAGEAFAKGDAEAASVEKSDPTHNEEHVAANTSAPRVIAEDDILPIIEELNRREERIKKREDAVAFRMKALSASEKEIERKLTALIDAEKRLRDTMALASTAAENDLTKLTEVYANMKPKQAAALFQQMDPQFAAGFLGRMRPDSAAAIMAGMEPETAYLVSVILAGRNADVPSE